MNPLSDSQRKWLTGYIGECWHEWSYIRGSVKQEIFTCFLCGETCKGVVDSRQQQRTFSTWADLGAVMEAIQKKGEWGAFYAELFNEWYVTAELKEDDDADAMFTAWLINPSRLPELVCQWKGVE